MGLEIPAQLRWLAPIVVGQHWPSGDETALRRLGDGWSATATRLGSLRATVESAAGLLPGGGGADGSVAVGAMRGRAQTLIGAMQTMEDDCSALAAQCDNAAAEIEYAKYMIIACLVLLAMQVATAIVAAVVTAGASLTEAAVAEVATRATVATLFRALVARIAELGAAGVARSLASKIAMNVGLMEGIDAGIQGLQFAEGTRTSWDWSKTEQSVELGVAGGAVGAVGELIPKGATDALADSALGRVADQVARGAVRGGVEGVATVAGTGNVDPNNLLLGLSAGMVGGSLGVTREEPFGDVAESADNIRALLNRPMDDEEPTGTTSSDDSAEPASVPDDAGQERDQPAADVAAATSPTDEQIGHDADPEESAGFEQAAAEHAAPTAEHALDRVAADERQPPDIVAHPQPDKPAVAGDSISMSRQPVDQGSNRPDTAPIVDRSGSDRSPAPDTGPSNIDGAATHEQVGEGAAPGHDDVAEPRDNGLPAEASGEPSSAELRHAPDGNPDRSPADSYGTVDDHDDNQPTPLPARSDSAGGTEQHVEPGARRDSAADGHAEGPEQSNHDHGPGDGEISSDQPHTTTGLADPTTVDGYVRTMRDLQDEWSELTVGQRVQRLQDIVNQHLGEHGVPAVKILLDINMQERDALFGGWDWAIRLNLNDLADRLLDDPRGFEWLVEVLYHEARHAEQGYLMARAEGADGSSAQQIQWRLGINNSEVGRRAAEDPLPQDSAEYDAARNWYESQFGAAAESRKTLYAEFERARQTYDGAVTALREAESDSRLAPEEVEDIRATAMRAWGNRRRLYENYRRLPEEADAWAVGKMAGDAFRVQHSDDASEPPRDDAPAEQDDPTPINTLDDTLNGLRDAPDLTEKQLGQEIEKAFKTYLDAHGESRFAVAVSTSEKSASGWIKSWSSAVMWNTPSFLANVTMSSHFPDGSLAKLAFLVTANGVGGALNGGYFLGWRNYYAVSLSIGTGVALSVAAWGFPDIIAAGKEIAIKLEEMFDKKSSAPGPAGLGSSSHRK